MPDSGTSLLRPVPRFVLLLLVIPLVVIGCRTYGGHGSEEATYQQIQQANQFFEEELQRSRAELRLLARTAEEQPQLEAMRDHYQALTIMHEAYLETHREKAERLSPSSRYRDLHRTLGSITAEQRLMRNQYVNARRSIAQLGEADTAELPAHVTNRSRYIVAPSVYERIRSQEQQQMTMRQALALALQQSTDELPESGEEELPEDASEAPDEELNS